MDSHCENEYVGSQSVYDEVNRTRQLVAEMNTGWHDEGQVRVFTPLNINYGPGLTLGSDCFINYGCTLLALGGITIGDGVFIGPHCVIATEYHPEDPLARHTLLTKPVVIGPNAWLGASVTVLAGVTIGADAIVAAGSVVTGDVPAGTVVAGTPAKVIRNIRRDTAR